MLNSVGLQNGGARKFLDYELPNLLTKDIKIIANIAGSSVDECARLAALMNPSEVDMVELNISCPNVKQGGAAFGTDCNIAAAVTAAVKKELPDKPLMVKLSPNVTSITDIAKAVEAAGADALSLINTLLGMRIDIRTRRPILKNNVGGLSGPAVFPVAVRMVWQVANAVNIPVVGMGGIATWEDAVEMMMAGASAVQVGAAIFADPYAPVKIVDGLEKYCEDNNIANISEIVGTVQPW
jgi:dihydroorotate dehydrogenase (NAD+) catalytic subunit